jgi:signal transduction histidine kinase/DNA-binding response OmpR family regulator
MLEGYDEQWRTAGLEHTATYSKVSPGEYTFRVRGASLRGEWGPEKEVSISISPPWWATWWAYVLYALVGISLLYWVYAFQVNRKLEKAEAQRLKELDEVKTRLYTNITHEFRTPLTVISGMADQMEADPQAWLGQGLKMIKRNANRLLELVNQMLDLSKLESGKMLLNLQQGDIITHLKYLVESVHSLAAAKNIRLHFYAEQEAMLMDFDAEKLQQVMMNLLSNAVKFTPEGGDVYINIRRKEKEAQHNPPFLQVRVRDNGPGIPEEQLPFIFDRFYQLDDASTRQNEGSGIGLALVRELLRLMGGEVSVKSKPGETEFTIEWPIRNESAAQSFSETQQAIADQPIAETRVILNENSEIMVQGNKPLVLLIEDNADVVAYLASCLEENYVIQVGKDGQEGIEIALENVPDLVITDVMMPYKDGFEVCATLKSDQRTSHIPIIMLTAKADMESKLEGLEKGADAYLAKPFHKRELNIRIRKLLELRQKLQQRYRSLSEDQQGTSSTLSENPSTEERFIQKLKILVETQLDNPDFSVEHFCREIGMSHSQLHRKMTALTGLSPNRFIRFVRLNKAKVLLQNGDTSIAQVAYLTGFNDPSYFGRMFKKEYGITPLEWKSQASK